MRLTAALDYLQSSLAALRAHYLSLDRGFPLRAEVRSLRAQRLQLQLWWVDTHLPSANERLWDCCEVEDLDTLSRESLARRLRSRGLPYNRVEVALADAPLRTAGPAFGYHPMRFRSYHPSAAAIVRCARELKERLCSAEGLKRARQLVRAALEQHTAPLRDQVELTNSRELTEELPSLALSYGDFHRRGRTVFEIPADLVTRFRRASLREISFGPVYLPTPAFYVFFGPQRDLSWRAGWAVDGAYVARVAPECWQFVITCAPPDPETYFRSTGSVEPVYCEAWGEGDYTVSAQGALDRLTAQRSAQREAILQAVAFPKRGAQVHALVSFRAQQELRSLPRHRTVWRKALKLLLNTLLYLSGYEAEAEQVSMARSLGYLIQPVGDSVSRAQALARARQLKLKLPSSQRRGDLSLRAARLATQSRRGPRRTSPRR